MKTLRKNFEFLDFDRSIECVPQSVKKIKKFKPDCLTCSINTRLPLDQSKSKFDQSTSNRKSIYLKKSDLTPDISKQPTSHDQIHYSLRI